jgi:hypothetical protein
MPRIDIQQINLFILRYRKILLALGFSLIVWMISSNPPNGNLVLIANQFIPANSKLQAEQFSLITIANFETESFISNLESIQSLYTKIDIQPGSLINQESTSSEKGFNNRVDVFVNLENQGNINPGSKLHLWSQSDEFSQLISSDAVVRTSESDSYGARLLVSIPLTDEYAVMQSQGIKVVQVD